MKSGIAKTLSGYLLCALLSLLIAGWVLELHKVDWHIPFGLERYGDRLYTLALVKGFLETGSYLTNSHLGAPGILESSDFPRTDHTQLALIKILSWFSSDYGMVANLFFLINFPLIACASLFVIQRFQIGFFPALVSSLLFAFLPYRLGTSQAHLFLVSYYMIPFTVLAALWLASGDRFTKRRAWGTLLICVLQACSGIYHTFFGAALILTGAILGAWRTGQLRRALAGGGLALVMFVTMTGNLLPSILYRQQHGMNPEVAQRQPEEAERFGLQIARMVLPERHRLPFLATEFKEPYGKWSYLGVAASVGFFYLLWQVFASNRDNTLLTSLACLNLAALLIGMSGGIGPLFAVLVSPQVRAYYRILVFVAFFSLTAVAWLLDRLKERVRPGFYAVLLAALLAIALWDQTVPEFSGYRPNAYWTYHVNQDFVRKIENSLPANAMVFQFPYTPFPESPPSGKMGPYDHFQGYLYSRTIHWSYAAMKGRSTDEWQAHLARKPWSEIIAQLRSAGFAGMYIDFAGFPESQRQEIENTIRGILQRSPLTCGDGRRLFFLLEGSSEKPGP